MSPSNDSIASYVTAGADILRLTPGLEVSQQLCNSLGRPPPPYTRARGSFVEPVQLWPGSGSTTLATAPQHWLQVSQQLGM